jgi:hypothetical protein
LKKKIKILFWFVFFRSFFFINNIQKGKVIHPSYHLLGLQSSWELLYSIKALYFYDSLFGDTHSSSRL